MAKIEKLQTKAPTPADIARWEMKKYSLEELFILFLVECWRDGTFTRKNEIPINPYFAFWWGDSEQGLGFWNKNIIKAASSLRQYGDNLKP